MGLPIAYLIEVYAHATMNSHKPGTKLSCATTADLTQICVTIDTIFLFNLQWEVSVHKMQGSMSRLHMYYLFIHPNNIV